MGWASGADPTYPDRQAGYAWPDHCWHPGCRAEIDRGVSYRCQGCGDYFCGEHLILNHGIEQDAISSGFCDPCAAETP